MSIHWLLKSKSFKIISLVLCITLLVQISPLPILADVSIPLNIGWNLISIPEEPTITDPAVVLSSIDGNYAQAVAYDQCDASDPWKLYDPADPTGSDLSAIDHTMGLWIEMTAADTLDVTSAPPSDTSMQICEGWNQIGYPMDIALPVSDALASIEGKYLRLFGHDLLDTADPWAFFDVPAPSWASDLPMLEPGHGYWLLATEDATLTLPEPGAPPVVDITDPIEGTEITSPIDVTGTVSSSIPADWTFEYRLKNDPTWTTFASGDTSTGTQVQGTFDPTLLLNGIYEIQLTATDLFGQSETDSADVLITGGMKIGLFTISFIDLAVPVAGIPITLTRTYDSRDKQTHDFGVGWTLDIRRGTYTNNRKPGDGWVILNAGDFFNTPCSISSEQKYHVTEIRFSDVEYYRFVLQPQMFGFGSAVTGGCLGSASFVQTGGLPGATLDVFGSTDVFWRRGTDQLYSGLSGITVFEPQEVRLTTLDGRQFDLTLDEGLNRIEDLNGNSLIIDGNGVTHSSGKSIFFTRDTQNRISRIIDPMGNTINYVYDADGDLRSVADQEDYITQFTYNSKHDLLDIIDPRGVRAIRTDYDENGRMIAMTDAEGNRIEITHDTDNKQEIVRDRLGNPTIYEYDEKGRILAEINALGHTTSYTYDASDNLLTETDPLNRTATKTYDANRNVLTSTDVEGNTSTMTYNGRGQVLTVTDVFGEVTTKSYDGFGNLLEVSDADGSNTYAYDGHGNMTSKVDSLGQVTGYAYDVEGNLTTVIDENGNSTSFAYDQNNQTLERTQTRTLPDGSVESLTTGYRYDATGNPTDTIDKLGNVVAMTNNAIGKLDTATDRKGNSTQYVYDALGNMSEIVYSDGSKETFTYDAEGRQLSHTVRDGYTTQYEYDALGRQIKTIYPDGSSVSTTYDSVGRVLTETDERGNVTTYDYAVRQKTIIDALGNVTIQEFDQDGPPVRVGSEGNLVKLTDARGNVLNYTYDVGRGHRGSGLLTQLTYPNGSMSAIDYDALGRKSAETDQGNHRTEFQYDGLGRLALVRDALGNGTTYTYDEVGSHVATTDARGNTSRFEYNALGGLTTRILPLNQEETFAYDANGNLVSYTDFNGQTTTFAYDDDNRQIEKTLPDSSTETFTYSTEGYRMQAGGETYTYNSRGWLLTATNASGDTMSYSYDEAGNQTSMTTPTGTTSYTYDALNRLETVTAPDGGVTTYTYDEVGNLLTTTTPNSVRTTWTYDALNRPTTIETRDSNSLLLASYAYTLAPTGDVLQVIEGHSGRSVDYAYDDNRQLLNETIDDPGASQRTITYTYDDVGNRLSKDDSAEGLTTYTYDENNRLLASTDSTSTTAYSYDDNGNLLTQSGPGINLSHTYDSRNRLIQFDDGTHVTEYAYDIDGNLIRIVVDGTDETHFLIDKNRTLAQVVRETDKTGAEISSYVYGHDLISMNRSATGSSYYHYDRQTSTRQLSDSTGAVQNTYAYDAFGNLLNSTGTTAHIAYRYTGERYEDNSGLYYLRARYYDPALGRFISSDPFQGYQQQPVTLNGYLYAHNQPINFTDPSGFDVNYALWIKAIVGGIGGAEISTVPNLDDGKLIFSWHETEQISVAVGWAKRLSRLQCTYGKENFTKWFGRPQTPERVKRVSDKWRKIQAGVDAAASSQIHFVPAYGGCSEDYYAYVYPGVDAIFLCQDEFFKDPIAPISADKSSQAGTIIHELSHLKAGTKDINNNYSYYDALLFAIALSNHTRGLTYVEKNAANYEWHSQDIPNSQSMYHP